MTRGEGDALELDNRGLHPYDSGFVYAVGTRPAGGKSRRKWFKTRSEAVSYADYWRGRGVPSDVLRFRISGKTLLDDQGRDS